MTKLTQKEKIVEYVRCAQDIEYFSEKYCTVWDKAKAQNIPFKLLPHQKIVLAAYKANRFNIIRKYRQGGITTITCLFIAHSLCFTPSLKVAVVANQLGLARDSIFSQVINIIRDLPDWLRMEPGDKDSMTYTKYTNKAEIMACAAGKNGIRGFSPDLAFLDEAAFLAFGDSFYTALMGSMSAGGRVILNSTANGMDPLYWKTYSDAAQGKNDYNVVDIYWYQDTRFNENLRWVKGEDSIEEWDSEKQKDLIRKSYHPTNDWFINICKAYNNDERKIAQEVNGDFLGSGGNMISEEIINRIEKDNVNGMKPPIRRDLERNGELWVWEEPIPGETYVIGSDISTGRSSDYQTIQVLKMSDGNREQVAEYQGKLPPEIIGEMIFELGNSYNNAYVVIDITGGYGIGTMTRLLDLGYTNVHKSEINAKPLRDRLSRYTSARDKGNVIPGFNIGANRDFILKELETRLRMQEFTVHSIRLIAEFKTFIHNGQRWDHMRGSHDDLIMAASMALYTFAFSFVSKNAGPTKDKLMAMAKGWRQVNSQEREQMATQRQSETLSQPKITQKETVEKIRQSNEKRTLRDNQDYFTGNGNQRKNPFQRF